MPRWSGSSPARPYASLRDFWQRARVSRPVAERLVLVGALDSLYAGPGPQPTRRDLLARVGVLAGPSRPVRGRSVPSHAVLPISSGGSTERGPGQPALGPGSGRGEGGGRSDGGGRSGRGDDDGDGGGGGDGEGLARIVPAGELPELSAAERVEAELEILGIDVSRHVISFYEEMLRALGVVRAAHLHRCRSGTSVLVAGVKTSTQTRPPAPTYDRQRYRCSPDHAEYGDDHVAARRSGISSSPRGVGRPEASGNSPTRTIRARRIALSPLSPGGRRARGPGARTEGQLIGPEGR